MVDALRVLQQVLHRLFAREPQRRGMPRDGLPAADGHLGPARCGLPQLRQHLFARDGLAGLLLQLPGQVRHPGRGIGHAAQRRDALHLPGRREPHPAQPGRGSDQRVGRLRTPRERYGNRGDEAAGHLLLQSAGGLPDLLRHACQQASRGGRLLEDAAPEAGRRGRVGQGQRSLQALYALCEGAGR